MSRGFRVVVLLLIPLLCVLVAAPSCKPLTTLATRTGQPAEKLGPAVERAAQRSGQQSDELAKRTAQSDIAADIIKNATEPAVKVACYQLTNRPAQPVSGSEDWLHRMRVAQMQGEPVREACEIAEAIASGL